jgi:hypothetical protein
MNAIKKFFQLTFNEKKTFAEATLLCIFIKLMVLLLPMKKYSRLLGAQNSVYGMEPNEKEEHIIYIVSCAIVRSRKIIPWKSQCLTEAITAKIMLQRRRVLSTLYLGVNKNNQDLIAHAWLRCGTTFVTGRKGAHQFVIVSTFA